MLTRVDANTERELRALKFAAMGDPIRLRIVDELLTSDRAPVELRALLGLESNLLAHHLDILESAGLITRSHSSGDGRRRYVRFLRHGVQGLLASPGLSSQRALFICSANSARSQLAAALWTSLTGELAVSAGTRPATRVDPRAIDAAQRAGLDLTNATPRAFSEITTLPALVITVCDRAHEELADNIATLHWSIADPVSSSKRHAFDDTVSELRAWIDAVRPQIKEVA